MSAGDAKEHNGRPGDGAQPERCGGESASPVTDSARGSGGQPWSSGHPQSSGPLESAGRRDNPAVPFARSESSAHAAGTSWEPIKPSERYTSLDLLRGFALFGVLIVNLLYFFRESLFGHVLKFHSHPGWANHAVDTLVTVLIEFKAFNLFSLTFGVGVAIQAERAAQRGARVAPFLLRRFLILLLFGICHLTLISNVDILTLYAVCGLLLIPLLPLPAGVLAVAGLAAIYLPPALPREPIFPSASVLQAHAAAATRIYSSGSFGEILAFRWHETKDLISPLLIVSAQKTLGLMLIGVALWRFGLIRKPQGYR